VIGLTYQADDRGARYAPGEVIRGVAKAANAPLYWPYATDFYFGNLGGYSNFDERIGVQKADLALEILAGKDPNAMFC
jgi:hypothetical protein